MTVFIPALAGGLVALGLLWWVNRDPEADDLADPDPVERVEAPAATT